MIFTPLPLSQTVTLSQTPSPLERNILYGWPLTGRVSIEMNPVSLKRAQLRNPNRIGTKLKLDSKKPSMDGAGLVYHGVAG